MKYHAPIIINGIVPTPWIIIADAWASSWLIKKKDVKTYTTVAWYVPTYAGAAGTEMASEVDIINTQTSYHLIDIPVDKRAKYVEKQYINQISTV